MLIMVALLQTLWAQEITWEKLYSDDGWRYSHTTENENGVVEVFKKEIDAFPCFLGKTTSNSDSSVLLEIATDTESAKEWSSAHLIESKTLFRSPSYMDYFQHLDVPLFNNRYWFLRGYIEYDDAESRFRWEPLNDRKHQNVYHQIKQQYPDSIETQINIGAWVFRQKPSHVEVRYYICTHPGGYVPLALQSIGTEKTLPNNLYDLVKEGKRRSGFE